MAPEPHPYKYNCGCVDCCVAEIRRVNEQQRQKYEDEETDSIECESLRAQAAVYLRRANRGQLRRVVELLQEV